MGGICGRVAAVPCRGVADSAPPFGDAFFARAAKKLRFGRGGSGLPLEPLAACPLLKPIPRPAGGGAPKVEPEGEARPRPFIKDRLLPLP